MANITKPEKKLLENSLPFSTLALQFGALASLMRI